MNKHTPGPWVHDTRGYPHPDVKVANGRNIACTWGVNSQPKTKEAYEAQAQTARANACLIAAAPDLLAEQEKSTGILIALRVHLAGLVSAKVLADIDERIAAGEAAIAKATGSSE